MQNFGYHFYRHIKEPKFICAPMVEQSELAFRMLTRRYGTQLCYTPMLHSRLTVEDKTYLKNNFSTCPEDRPLVVQFCGNDPDTLLQAAQMVEDQCDAVDINLGCPQGIAKKGHYGSFLLSEPELIGKMVENLAKNLKVPVTCKIRILPREKDTMHLVNTIVKAGCSLLTVHGRTKEQNKQKVGKCDWDTIRKIKQSVNIPVFANGGIYSYEDAIRCLEYTGVDGVMSSESLLENPALFSGKVYNLDDLALEYLEICKTFKTDHCYIRPHLFKMLFTGLQKYTDLREELVKMRVMEDFEEVVRKLQARRIDESPESKLGWYMRYMPPESLNAYNDYKIFKNKQPIMIEESKDNEKERIKEEPQDMGTHNSGQEVDLNGLFG
jgi:tRNA-dihydrouridine synthase 1